MSPRAQDQPASDDRNRDIKQPLLRAWRQHLDVVIAVLLAVVAMAAALRLEPGGIARILLVAPLVLAVPGYLLIEAAMGPSSALRRRPLHAAVALGVTPAVMGLVGLATALVFPSGFRPLNVMIAVTAFCLVCAGVALTRRAFAARPSTGSRAPAGTSSGAP